MNHVKIFHHAGVTQHSFLGENKYFLHLIVKSFLDQIFLSLLGHFPEKYISSDLTSFVFPNQGFSFEQTTMIGSFLLLCSNSTILR